MARIGFEVTAEQKKWLDSESKRTGESSATIMRQMINEKMKVQNERK